VLCCSHSLDPNRVAPAICEICDEISCDNLCEAPEYRWERRDTTCWLIGCVLPVNAVRARGTYVLFYHEIWRVIREEVEVRLSFGSSQEERARQ
jgi:hypothetical protein